MLTLSPRRKGYLSTKEEPWQLSRYSNYVAGPKSRGSVVRLSASARDSTLPQCSRRFWGHAASHSMCTVRSFPGIKRPGNEVDHSPTSSTKINNEWSYAPFHPMRGITLVFSLNNYRAYHTRRIFLIIFNLFRGIHNYEHTVVLQWSSQCEKDEDKCRNDVYAWTHCRLCHMIRIRLLNL
jgi:hypothetical protein